MATALQLLNTFSSPVSILKDGDALQTRPRINIIEGSNVTIDVTDDPTNYKTDITITATGGGGSGVGTVTSVDLSGGTTGMSFSGGPITSSGTITLDGTLGVANGGTGKVTFTSGYVKADGTTAFTSVASIPGTDITGNISGNASSLTSVLPISLGGTNATTASDARTSLGLGTVAVENIVPIAKGGTGATTASDARTALDVPTKAGSGATGTWGIDISGNAATVSNGVYTTGSYANPAWITSLAGSKVSGNISGNAANVTGVVAIANGGTGATTATAALNALGGYAVSNPAGYTTNTGTVTSVAGNGTVNGITLTGTVTTSGNITLGGTLSGVSLTSQVTGTLPIGNGGTNATTAAGALTNLGAYPASNPNGYTSNTGTVTSVGLSAGTGISISGGPVTTSGSITVTNSAPVPSGGAKFSLLGKNSTTNYDTAWFGPYVVNVKQYGAVGDGSTNDTTAINNAIAALTNYSCLYFPPGQYNVTGLTALSGLSNVVITGESATIYQTTQANNLWVIDSNCSRIDIENLIFGGAATSRLNGIHLRFRASGSTITNCEFYGSSDFLLFVGDHNNVTPTQYISITDCQFHDSKGDGIHLGNCQYVFVDNCVAWNTGDDSFAAVGYESRSDTVKNISFRNCWAYNAGARGFAMLMVTDCLLENCYVDTSQLSGFEVGPHVSTTAFNERITIRNCSCINTMQTGGPYAAFNVYFAKQVQIQNVTVRNPATSSAVAVYDFDDVQISDLDVQCTRAGFFRGLITPDVTTLLGRTARTTWGNLFISGYSFDTQQTDNYEAIYIMPASGITIANLMIVEAKGSQVNTNSYIVYNRINGTAKIGNCVCLQSRSITWGGVGSSATTFNNN